MFEVSLKVLVFVAFFAFGSASIVAVAKVSLPCEAIAAGGIGSKGNPGLTIEILRILGLSLDASHNKIILSPKKTVTSPHDK